MQPSCTVAANTAESRAKLLGQACGQAVQAISLAVGTMKRSLEEICVLHSAAKTNKERASILAAFRTALETHGGKALANKYMTTVNQVCSEGLQLLKADPNLNRKANMVLGLGAEGAAADQQPSPMQRLLQIGEASASCDGVPASAAALHQPCPVGNQKEGMVGFSNRTMDVVDAKEEASAEGAAADQAPEPDQLESAEEAEEEEEEEAGLGEVDL